MRTRLEHLVAGVLAVALAAAGMYSYFSWERSRDQLLELLAEFGTGAREPGVVSDVRREPDAVRARLLVARAFLAEELDRRWLADLVGAERESAEALSLRKLELADSMARGVLAAQPASWQARMILAGSTYLKMSRLGDPDRWRERWRWEQPLRDAMAMATSQVEPRRILAAAYLNDWSLMTESERQSARDVLRVAFRDRVTLEQLLPAWLRRADSLGQALDLIPADSSSWQHVEQYFRVRQDWERVCEARTRSLAVLPEYLERTLADAEKRLAGGDKRGARSLALNALARLPIGPVHGELLDRLLRTLPPGPIPAQYQQRTRDWLAWTRRECLLGRCPLPKAVIRRLRALSQYATSAGRAWAAELAGDTYSAESHERDALIPNASDWAPYLLLKAKRLTASGEAGEAAAALAMIHPDWAERAVTRAVRALVWEGLGVSSRGQAGDWQSPAILYAGETSFKEYFWRQPPEKIRLRFGSVASTGAAVQILWSDRIVGCYSVDSGAVITLAAPRTSGFHVLEVRPLPGSRAALADIRVIPEFRSARPAPRPRS
ncbi:MAG: hypothetical protein IH936_12630 [Acidobacteria bacterium]|nr:hypothetical protein [Acidobacteriota bacterium]